MFRLPPPPLPPHQPRLSRQAVVTFSDGSSQDFSEDERATFTVTSGAALVARFAGNALAVQSDALVAGAPPLVEVELTFPGLFDLAAVAAVAVVEFDTLELTGVSYPSEVQRAPPER